MSRHHGRGGGPFWILSHSNFYEKVLQLCWIAGRLLMNGLRTGVLSVIFGSCVPAVAQTTVTQYKRDIPRQPLTAALADFARETGLQVARFSDTAYPVPTVNA